MKDWVPFLKDLINLIAWMAMFSAIVFKALNTWEKIQKEKVASASKILERMDKIEQAGLERDKKIEANEKRSHENSADIGGLKEMVKEMGSRMWDFLKNKHE